MPRVSRVTVPPSAAWVVIASLCFVPGLSGPFLLDDLPNLQHVFAWAEGNLPLSHVLSQGDAGPLGRPLSLLSFVVTAATSGTEAYGFKATNLFIHLVNGLLAGALLQRLFSRIPALRDCPRGTAWVVAAAWTILPMHVPTVLYVVQRMTLLSATFSLATLLTWFVARERLEREPNNRGALALLCVAVPLLTLLAALAKETGLLAPLLCAVLELTLFRASTRPRAATWFVRVGVLLPVLATAAYLATHPAYVLGGYSERPFTFFERVLSQPRALWDYAGLTLVPRADRLGLYQDTFVASSGWFEPATTLPAIAAWSIVGLLALVSLRRLPGLAMGIGWFLVGHLLESSIFALEPFFIHRNYLPSMGLMIVVVSLLAWSMQRVRVPVRRTVALLCAALLLVLALTTGVRSWTWGSSSRLMESELAHNPDSFRLRSDLAAQAISARQVPLALHHLDAAERIATEPDRRAVRLWRVLALCSAGIATPDVLLAGLRDGGPHRITPYTMRALETLASQAETGRCKPVPAASIANAATQWLEHAPQPAAAPAVWRSRYATARLLSTAGHLERGQDLAIHAFTDSGHAFPPGVLAFQLSFTLGDRQTALKVYRALDRREPSGDPREAEALSTFENALREQVP